MIFLSKPRDSGLLRIFLDQFVCDFIESYLMSDGKEQISFFTDSASPREPASAADTTALLEQAIGLP